MLCFEVLGIIFHVQSYTSSIKRRLQVNQYEIPKVWKPLLSSHLCVFTYLCVKSILPSPHELVGHYSYLRPWGASQHFLHYYKILRIQPVTPSGSLSSYGRPSANIRFECTAFTIQCCPISKPKLIDATPPSAFLTHSGK